MNYFVRSALAGIILFGSSGLIIGAAAENKEKEKDYEFPNLSFDVGNLRADFANQQAAYQKRITWDKRIRVASATTFGLGAALQCPGLPEQVRKIGQASMAAGGLTLAATMWHEIYRPLPDAPIAPDDQLVTRKTLHDLQSRNVKAMQDMLKFTKQSLGALEKRGEKNLDEKEKGIKAYLVETLAELKKQLATQYAPIASGANPYITLTSLQQQLQVLEASRNETRHNAIFAASDMLRLQIDACVKTSDFDRFTKTCATINALQQLRAKLAEEAKQEQERVNGRFDTATNDFDRGIGKCVLAEDYAGHRAASEAQRAQDMISLAEISSNVGSVGAALEAQTQRINEHDELLANAKARRWAAREQQEKAARMASGLTSTTPTRKKSSDASSNASAELSPFPVGNSGAPEQSAAGDDGSSVGGDGGAVKQADASEQPEKPVSDERALAESLASESQLNSSSSGSLSTSLSDALPTARQQEAQLRRGASRRNVRPGTGNPGPLIARGNRNQQG